MAKSIEEKVEEHFKTDHAYCFPEDKYGSRYLGYADVPDVI